MSSQKFQVGSKINDRFVLVKKIGEGATSQVFEAIDNSLNRNVAVKIIPKKDSLEERIKREIKITASLNHPNIVTLYDFLASNDSYIVVMEYIEGVSLRKMLEKRKKLPWDKAVFVAIQIASALEEAHKKSIVHKDIKPENVLISKDGKVKLGDFGISSLITREKSGLVSGTIGYMSPEQITGKYVDETSDIYALGVILYEMLTGINPFLADEYKEAVHKTLNLVPEDPHLVDPSIPKKLSEIVMKAIAKDPDFRFQSATALKKALSDFQQSQLKIAEKEIDKKKEEKELPVKKTNFHSIFMKFVYLASFFLMVFFVAPIQNRFEGMVGIFLSLAIFLLGFIHPQAANIVASLAVASILISTNSQIGILFLVSIAVYLLFNSDYLKNLAAPLPFVEILTAPSGFFPFSSFLLASFAEGSTAFTGGIAASIIALLVKMTSKNPNLYYFSGVKSGQATANASTLLQSIFLNIQVLSEIFIFTTSLYIAAVVRRSISGKPYSRLVSVFTFMALLLLGYQIHSSIFKLATDSTRIFFSALPGFLTSMVVIGLYEAFKKWYEK
ncbi:MAG: serine/threonine protein kinase [Actinobacteria bacterium]|nr:serine/threonine protein kinase [Actinomycetota bacterium]